VDPWTLGWEYAGILGVHPGQWSLRQLFDAVRGRRREAWNHTSALIAQQAEFNRDPKKRPHPFDSSEFHPMREPPSVPVASDDVVRELI
jgi:hypothetical protein